MKHNIFDNMTILPESVSMDTASVCEETGIDFKKVKGNVFSELGLKKPKTKKRFIRKMIIAAAAALLGVSILSLPVVAENLYVLYGSVVGGDEYTADFVNVKNANIKMHDPNLQVESLQVSANEGADHLIDIRLTKKNGGTFTDNNFNIIKDGGFDAWLSDGENPAPDDSHQLEMIIQNTDHSANGLGYNAVYGLENDGRILRILIDINAFGKSLQGKQIYIKSNSYLISSIDSVLGSFTEMNQQNVISACQLQQDNSEAISYDLFTNSFYYTDIMYTDDRFEVVKGRAKKVSLPFEIEFTMDCQSVNHNISVSDETLNQIFGNHPTEGKMTVSSAGFFLYAKNDTMAELPDNDLCYLLTKDGSKYYLIGNGSEYSEKNIVMNCTFGKFPNNQFSNNFDHKFYLIDPKNIDRIVINGITVYQN